MNYSKQIVVAIVGGDGRHQTFSDSCVTIRTFASSQYGNGSSRRLIDAIRGRRLDFVLLRVSLLGHSDARAISSACRAMRLRYALVPGGRANALRTIAEFVAEVRRG